MVSDRKAEKAAEKKEKVDALIRDLKQRADRFREDNEAFQTFLRQSARFHSYSVANQYLIFCQRPDATAVNSFKRWKELGRQVMRGEKAIYIVAPRPYKKKDLNGSEEERVGFVHVPVFEYGQTEPIEDFDGDVWEPYRFPSLTEETGGEYVEALIASLESDGHTVERFDDRRTYRGRFHVPNVAGSVTTIELSRAMPMLQQFNTLVHELAHMTHWELDPLSLRTFGDQAIEFVGEASSYAVLSEFGFDSSEKSVSYIGARGDFDNPDKEKVVMKLVVDVVGKIMERMESLSISDVVELPMSA